MEKRVFLAIFLCFVVLAVYQAIFPPAPTQPASPAPEAATATQPAMTPPAAGTFVGDAPPAASDLPPTAAPLVAATDARDIVVETDYIRAVFSTSGATLRSWTLKKYFDGGQPFELVPSDLPDAYAKPFTLTTNDPALSRTLATALYQPSTEQLSLVGSTPGTLEFQYRDQSGLNARKTFHFQPEGKPYIVKVEATVDVAGTSRPVVLNSGPALGSGDESSGWSAKPAQAVFWQAAKVERVAADALQERPRYEGELRFAGVETQYFLNAALPGAVRTGVDYQPIRLPASTPEAHGRTFAAYTIAVPGSLTMSYFLGPKDFDVLRDVDRELTRTIDFGIFSWLVVPLLQALKWVNGFLGNYGWAIVVLTVLINLAIFPLRHRSMVSMRKMQTLQPEMKAIQERYKKYKVTDPERQKMNQEMMALYKQKGVNPVSGCIPMLLTMPILFAFYSMLYSAIEMRGAPFMGWISDLSQHDPLYITPVLMGLSMFWQQKMMPTTADPIQQKIFLLMPVIFTVSFMWAPAGLVVYWFVSNLMAIGQQYVTNRIIGAPAKPAPARAASKPGPAAKSQRQT